MHILIKSCKTLFGISCSPAYIGSCLGVSFVLLLYATLWSPLPYPFPHYSELTSIQKYIKLKYMFIQMQKYSYNHIITSPHPSLSLSKSFRHSHTYTDTLQLQLFPCFPLSHSLSCLIINPLILVLKFELVALLFVSN